MSDREKILEEMIEEAKEMGLYDHDEELMPVKMVRPDLAVCPKCNSSIRTNIPRVLEVHAVMCESWAKENLQ